MDLSEARELVAAPYWPQVRDEFLATGTWTVYPKDDPRRRAYLPADVQTQIDRWLEAISKVDEWRLITDGARVRQLKADYPGIYPDVLRYAAYFVGKKDVTRELMKLKFPEAYQICYS